MEVKVKYKDITEKEKSISLKDWLFFKDISEYGEENVIGETKTFFDMGNGLKVIRSNLNGEIRITLSCKKVGKEWEGFQTIWGFAIGEEFLKDDHVIYHDQVRQIIELAKDVELLKLNKKYVIN